MKVEKERKKEKPSKRGKPKQYLKDRRKIEEAKRKVNEGVEREGAYLDRLVGGQGYEANVNAFKQMMNYSGRVKNWEKKTKHSVTLDSMKNDIKERKLRKQRRGECWDHDPFIANKEKRRLKIMCL